MQYFPIQEKMIIKEERKCITKKDNEDIKQRYHQASISLIQDRFI